MSIVEPEVVPQMGLFLDLSEDERRKNFVPILLRTIITCCDDDSLNDLSLRGAVAVAAECVGLNFTQALSEVEKMATPLVPGNDARLFT